MTSADAPNGFAPERRIVLASGLVVLALGLAVLAGWALDLEVLKSALPGRVTMKPNAALGFVLAGAGLVLAMQRAPQTRRLAAVPAALLTALALLTLAQDLFGFDAGIDQLLSPDDRSPAETGRPGRMAPLGALGLALVGGALLLRRTPLVSQAFALVALAVGGLSLMGYAYGAEEIYRVGALTAVALHTGVGLLAAASGALLLEPRAGIAAALLDRSAAGHQLRRLLPTAFAVPLVSGAIALAGARSSTWDPGVEASVVAVAAMLALLGVAFVSYRSLRGAESRRLEAVASLAESEDRYRRSFENVTIGMAHLAADGRWLRVNTRLAELLGYSAEELCELTYAQVSHLDDLELDVKQWELLRRGEISGYGTERRFLTKGGEEVIADVRLVREEDANGRLVHVIAVIQDVTGRKLSEGTLRLYERALAATQNGIVITDASADDHPITYVNRAFLEITGFEASDVIGRNCRFLNARARDQVALDELRRAVKRGESCSVLLRNHRKDGEPFWNQLSIAPVRDADDHLTHFVGVVIDASERVRASSEREELLASAENANRAKDRFLSVVSHELRSPLNAILAWTSLLRDAGDPEGVTRAVGAIEAAIGSQTRLVDDLLDASRMRVGGLEVVPQRTDTVALARTAVDQLRPGAAEAGVELTFETTADALPAMADPERLSQIVRNLVENAIKFTSKGGRVDVALREDGDGSVIEVRDTGRGIDRADLPRVFDEFWQGDRKGGGSGGKGLGLGLAVVKHLVERQGGRIEVESEGRGRGACFRVHLPAAHEGEARARPEEPDDEEGRRLAGVEVVVVDDEEGTVEAIAAALRKAGAVAHEAQSVAEALRFFDQTTPEILVSDIGLPDRDGLDLIRAVRELEEPKRTTLALAVTGFADRAERRRIQRAGFDAYLAKPVEPALVVDRVLALRRAANPETPRSRSILLCSDPSREATALRGALERAGHRVREIQRPQALADEVGANPPDLVIARIPLSGVSAASLADRLEAVGCDAPLIGILAPEDETEQKPFDFVLWKPLHNESLLRLVQLAGEVG